MEFRPNKKLFNSFFTMSSNNVGLFCKEFSAPINTATKSSVQVQPSIICEIP